MPNDSKKIYPVQSSPPLRSSGPRLRAGATLYGIYLDYAAATPLDSRVAKLICRLAAEFFGNPSSAHSFGSSAKKVLEDARKKIAQVLSVKSEEITLTGSGTESDNLAIFGVAEFYKNKGRHIVTSEVEHLAVLNSCKALEKKGFKVTYLSVDEKGLVSPEQLKKAIRADTVLVSIMQANNEIGTVQPIKELGAIILQWRKANATSLPYFHTDSCQAAGFLNIRPHPLGVDLLTFNGSKIYGPKGVACLYKKNSVGLAPLFQGGSQERGLRPGTENVALAAGLALALEIAEKEKKKEVVRLKKLRDWFVEKCLKEISDSKLNGDAKKRLPNNINISFKDIDGEMLMLALDQKGVAVSTGSACTTSKTDVSHVIKAIGGNRNWGNVRISFGRETSKNDLDKALEILKSEVGRIRKVV